MGEAKRRRDAPIEEQTIIHDAPNVRPIETLVAILSIDGDGNEGIMVVPMGGMSMPLVVSDPKHLPTFEKVAAAALELTGSTKGYTVATFQRVRTKQ